MKRLLAIAVIFFAAHAHAEDKSSGCGLGWKVTQRNSLVSSFVRALTNYTTTSTFAMTSGTSGCDHHSIVSKDKQDIHYAEANFESLMVDMAKGNGAYLQGFAMVMGCNANEAAAFSQVSQKNYDQFFPNSGTTPNELVNSVRDTVGAQGLCGHQQI